MPEEGSHKTAENTRGKGVKNMEYNYSSKWYSRKATICVRKGTYGYYTHIYIHKGSLIDYATN